MLMMMICERKVIYYSDSESIKLAAGYMLSVIHFFALPQACSDQRGCPGGHKYLPIILFEAKAAGLKPFWRSERLFIREGASVREYLPGPPRQSPPAAASGAARAGPSTSATTTTIPTPPAARPTTYRTAAARNTHPAGLALATTTRIFPAA